MTKRERVQAALAGQPVDRPPVAFWRHVPAVDHVDLPVHAVNWHDRRTTPTLAQARARFAGALVGGLDEWQTLREGPPPAIAAQALDAIAQTDGLGLILAPGCVLPLDVPDIHLRAVVQAVTSPSMIKTK